MKTAKWPALVLMLSAISVKAATPIDNVIRSVEQRIPEIRQLPEDPINIQRPDVQFELPQEALNDAKQRLKELDDAALITLDPLQDLPNQLTILDASGNTVLIEEEVENGWRAVANEWLLVIEEKDLGQLKKIGAKVVNISRLQHLGMMIVIFKVPDGLNTRKALEEELPANWISQLGRNHLYEANTQQVTDEDTTYLNETAVNKTACQKPVVIGMIDTAIETNHSALIKANIKTKNFMQGKILPPTGHGTAVAGILVGDQDKLKPLLPNATLYSASVFYSRNKYSQGATLINLVRALDWMTGNRVPVINMSLTGPDNPILQKAVAKTTSEGVMVVAAVGNEGPASRPLYPSAYPEVIGVTAVDSKQQIYRWANQGDQIDFAALGVSVLTSRANNQLGRETGTSIAAPVVSAMVTCELSDESTQDVLVERLQQKALDLGEKGKDTVFGYGLLQAE